MFIPKFEFCVRRHVSHRELTRATFYIFRLSRIPCRPVCRRHCTELLSKWLMKGYGSGSLFNMERFSRHVVTLLTRVGATPRVVSPRCLPSGLRFLTSSTRCHAQETGKYLFGINFIVRRCRLAFRYFCDRNCKVYQPPIT